MRRGPVYKNINELQAHSTSDKLMFPTYLNSFICSIECASLMDPVEWKPISCNKQVEIGRTLVNLLVGELYVIN